MAFGFLIATPAIAQQSDNVVLITIDGLRHQELFGGIDGDLLEGGAADGIEGADATGIESPDGLREDFWRPSADARRDTLMPFFWSELAPRGVVMRSVIQNPHRNSFPGYSEILTGQVLAEITGNIDSQIPVPTVLDIARRELGLDAREVAVFTSWEHFNWIVEQERGSMFVNAGYASVPETVSNAEMDRWSALQFDMRTPWDSVRHNAVTVGLALEHMKAYRPRVVFIALDETDEWAHARRYDRTVQAIRSFDDALREIWRTLQSIDSYRDRTTLVLTTDHGRGRTLEDWTSHGGDVDGSDETWIAIVGPGTPARGIVSEQATNGQVAATMLAALGLDPTLLGANAGEPIEVALR